MTNVRTGAARPDVSADGRFLAYEQYHAHGFEIRWMTLDPSRFLDRGTLPRLPGDGPLVAELVGESPVPVDPVAVASWTGDALGGTVRGGAPSASDVAATAAGLRPQDVPGLRDPYWDGADGARAVPALPWEPGPHPATLQAPPSLAATGRAGPRRGTPRGTASAPRQSAEDLGNYDQIDVEDAFGDEEDFAFDHPVRRYNPAGPLAPRYWVPSFATTPRLPNAPSTGPFDFLGRLPPPFAIGGLSAAASTSATDPLRHHAWSGVVRYRTDANAVGGGFSYTLNRFLPVLTVGGSTSVNPYTYLVLSDATERDEDGEPVFTGDDVHTAYFREYNGFVAFSYPFTPRSTFFANYSFTHRALTHDLAPGAERDTVALRGTLGQLTAGYRYGWSQPNATSISPEDGRSLTVQGTVSAPWLGTFAHDELTGERTPLTQVLIQADWREYVANPLAPNHVFAFRGGAGVAFGGEDRFLGNFQLGGNGLGAFRALRGYGTGSKRGDTYWLVGHEYRFPLWRMDRGFGTVPLFFRVLHGAVFVEAGNAFTTVESFVDVFDDTAVGAGLELRLKMVLAWSASVDVRVGYAVGLTQGGYWFDDPRAAYVLVSGLF